jgi:hypothetical protein
MQVKLKVVLSYYQSINLFCCHGLSYYMWHLLSSLWFRNDKKCWSSSGSDSIPKFLIRQLTAPEPSGFTLSSTSLCPLTVPSHSSKKSHLLNSQFLNGIIQIPNSTKACRNCILRIQKWQIWTRRRIEWRNNWNLKGRKGRKG